MSPRRLGSTRFGIAVGAFAAVTSVGPRAHSFSYPEHYWISQQALLALNARSSSAAQPFFQAVVALTRRTDPANALTPELATVDEARFQLGDIPALAADHSSTPRNLLYRWFWSPSKKRQCSMPNLFDGMAFLDDRDQSPTVCMADMEGRRFLPSRHDFIATVRRYLVDGKLRSTREIDPKLAADDCAYLCLAERGRTHFRIPTVPTSEMYYHYETPNAAFAYAKHHAIAVGLAAMAREPEIKDDPRQKDAHLGLAMFFELFALHFLQDGVAAGHIVSPYVGYGNMTVNITHDHYNKEGLPVMLPRALCDRLKRDAPPSDPGFARLREQCAAEFTTRNPIVRGDHAIADGLVNRREEGRTDVTVDLAVFLSMVSMQEVVTAAGAPAGTWLTGFKSELISTVAAFKPPVLSAEQLASDKPGSAKEASMVNAADECNADWGWGCGDPRVSEYKQQRAAALIGAQRNDREGMGAAGMWPSPSAATKPYEAPGGHHLYLRTSIRNVALGVNGDVTTSLGAGYAFMATLLGKPLIIATDGFATYSSFGASGFGRRWGGGVHSATAVHWARFGGLSLLNEIGVAAEATDRAGIAPRDQSYAFEISAYGCPISYEMTSDLNALHFGIIAGGGDVLPGATKGSRNAGFGFLGIEIAATYHTERPASMRPVARR